MVVLLPVVAVAKTAWKVVLALTDGAPEASVKRTDGAVLVAVLPILVVLQPTNTLPEHALGTDGADGIVPTELPLLVVVLLVVPFTFHVSV